MKPAKAPPTRTQRLIGGESTIFSLTDPSMTPLRPTRVESMTILLTDPRMAQVRKRGAACDPLDGRFGFKDGSLTRPALELNNRANEASPGRNRRKRPRAAPISRCVRRKCHSH